VSDLHKALSDIGSIRLQLAAGTMFRGFGPAVMAVTGVLALAAAAMQSLLLDVAGGPLAFIALWGAVAVFSAGLIGIEMVARTRRHHGGLADAMLFHAVEHFLAVGVAGAVVCAVLLRFAPDTAWVLPGLWEILVAVGLFAALRFLPRSIALAGGWYFVAGATVLIVSSLSRTLSPWAMGLPFGLGQLLVAGLLHVALGTEDGEE
jgi:hypothetical protein